MQEKNVKTIVIDCHGGDNSPRAQVLGAVFSLKKQNNFNIILVGKEDEIKAELALAGECTNPRINVVNATQIIDVGGVPSEELAQKRDSSMVVALELLKTGKGDSVVSSGSTGALFLGAYKAVGRVGKTRPCIAGVAPSIAGKNMLLLDMGANADCKPEHLLDFAILGNDYAKKTLKIERPKIALLSNGTEASKGSLLVVEAHKLLSDCPDICFIGNLEGRDFLTGACDVLITDGFTGNVALKVAEGMAECIFKTLKTEIKNGGIRARIGYLLLKKQFKNLKQTLDIKQTGGAVFLGIAKPVVKAHGGADEVEFCNAVLRGLELGGID